LAQVDLVHVASGYQVLDVNPRYYVSLPLATRCGVNLPAAWHDVVRGQVSGGPSEYRLGMRYRWLEADLTVLRHRWRPLLGPRAGALWDARDPIPGLVMGARATRQRVWAFGRAKGAAVWSRAP
jgi:predicted ATP-grasp superfamily ATP-dependent carboligase